MTKSRRELLIGTVIAGAAGAVWGLCLGTSTHGALAWVALVPWLVLLSGRPWAATWRRRAWWGLVHGTVCWWVSIPWIPPTLVTFGGLPRWLSWILMTVLCAYLGLFHALFAVLARRAAGRGLVHVFWAWPALWAVIEWLRGLELTFLSFPWNLAAYAWVDLPGALPLAAWIGAYGVSVVVLFANVGVALAWIRRRTTPAFLGLLLPLLLLGLAARFSRGPQPDRPSEIEVRIVQPDADLQVSANEAVWEQYRDLVRRSSAACDGTRALLIWPESAAWPFAWDRAPHLRADVAGLGERGCGLVFNTTTFANGDVINSALLVDRGAAIGRYDKQRLVPFGEYVPLAEVFPFVGKLARHSGNFVVGPEDGVLAWENERLGLSICYEVIFPEEAARQTRDGATLLVTVSNDAWYGDSSAPRQLFRAARFRSAENRRPMLRAALTGISGLIDERGQVVRHLGLGRRGVIRARVDGRTGLTPFTRAPWLVPLVSFVLSALALVLGSRGGSPD